jgi:glycosyltransferase involved in cell wall biosynthesis
MIDVALNTNRRSTLGAAARERVLAHFSEDAMLRAYESLYAGESSFAHAGDHQLAVNNQCVG